jgi:hypothetical protein
LTFGGPEGLLVEGGVQTSGNFGETISLGRLIFVQGLTAEGVASAVDLQVVVTLTRPAGAAASAILKFPLTIVTVPEIIAGDTYRRDSQIILPSSFDTATFELPDAQYRLKVIGFGTRADNGTITTVPSLDLPADEVVTVADLYAVVEACGITFGLPAGVPIREEISDMGGCGPTSLGAKTPRWGRFGPKSVLEFDSGEKLQLVCATNGVFSSGAFQLFYTPANAPASHVRVGLCPFEGGCNEGHFYHSGDQNANCKPDRLLKTYWLSRDFGQNDESILSHLGYNAWTQVFDPFENKLDWAETIFDATTSMLTKTDYKWEYNLPAGSTTIPMEWCSGGVIAHPEGNLVATSSVDPPVGPATEAFFDAVLAQIPVTATPMAEARTKVCDLDGNGGCDAADRSVFNAKLGACRGDARYDPRADGDASGCIESRDALYVFETLSIVEFYNAALDHYFISGDDAEIAALDAGTQTRGWTRTGLGFNAYLPGKSGASPVCRFYIPPGRGDSHFFGRGAAECAATAQQHPEFTYESNEVMDMGLPSAGACAAGTVPVYRVFSNRPDANHRYTTNAATRDEMVARGWLAEGDGPDQVVMCAPPS